MGIQGLLPLLKSTMSRIHIKGLEGCCVAVDTYSWLHKGALSCSAQLCKGLPTSKHIDYCMHRVNMLRHYGIKPILVFDGGLLPMKIEQENKRERSRKENLARAVEHESSGNSAAAYEFYQKSVDISPAIAYGLIQVLKKEGVHYIVAPYEADAQMAFLAITKQVDAVITEDSDLIAFGCPRIIYKMDKFGQGVEFQLSKLQHNKDPSFVGFTNDMLLAMCILSGCDYLPSLPGMGPKRAYAFIRKFKTFDKVIKHLRYSTVAIPSDYEKLFRKAFLTFRHQRVYDPNKEDIVHLSNISDDVDEDLDFLGSSMPQNTVKAIAKGELDPITKLPLEGDNVKNPVFDTSYQLKDFKPEGDKKKLDLPAQKNILTNYFCFTSLDTKRKFRAPRVSPKHPDLGDEFPPTIRKQDSGEATDCKASGSPEFTSDSVISSTAISSHNLMETKFSPKDTDGQGSPEENLLEQSSHSFHKPCIVLRKNREPRDHEHGSHSVSEATSLHGQEAIITSSYIPHTMVDENDPNCISNGVALRSSYFLDKSDDTDADGKNKKIVVRSSYFKHSKSSKAPRINETDMQIFKNEPSVNHGSEKSHCEDLLMKRKASPVHNNSEEHVQNKHARTDTGAEAGPDLCADGNSMDSMVGEEKFGCNISHLGHYSDISGKSLDKFVSVISSFKYSSSGSRASGLRAPLREVKNICPNRAQAAAFDIGKFAYVPSHRKLARGMRRV